MSNEASVSAMVNLRDVAETVSGVVPGVLLRSEAPSSPNQYQTIEKWPPATVIDLREPMERGDSHPLGETANIVHLPVLGRAPEDMMRRMPESLSELYSQMLEPPASAKLIEAVELIASAPTPVLVHCSGGKDRTGVLVALTLTLAGAPPDEVVADYVRTDAVIDVVMQRLTTFFNEVIPAGMPAEVPDELVRAPASAIRIVLDQLAAHGGAEEWFLSNGGSRSTITALCARLCTK